MHAHNLHLVRIAIIFASVIGLKLQLMAIVRVHGALMQQLSHQAAWLLHAA